MIVLQRSIYEGLHLVGLVSSFFIYYSISRWLPRFFNVHGRRRSVAWASAAALTAPSSEEFCAECRRFHRVRKIALALFCIQKRGQPLWVCMTSLMHLRKPLVDQLVNAEVTVRLGSLYRTD